MWVMSLRAWQTNVGVFDRRPTNTWPRRSVLAESDVSEVTGDVGHEPGCMANKRRGLRPPTYKYMAL
jgi:hypothetical protein